jgi:hypothetical protein
MSDLIRRQDAIDALGEEPVGETDWDLGCRNQWEWDTEILRTLPSAEPERNKGEWRHLGGDEWCCTNCGYVVSTEGAWERPKEQGKDYCEHCGADMRGE